MWMEMSGILVSVVSACYSWIWKRIPSFRLRFPRIFTQGRFLQGKQWTQWVLGFKNYLSTMLGVSGVPLNYVVCDVSDIKNTKLRTDELAILVSEAVLSGPVFKADNRIVYQILNNCALVTPSWEWIRRGDKDEDGRSAFNKFSEHYDGPGETRK
jgi:hypothetical protein